MVAFGVLRWSHCLLFSLAMFSAYANIDSEISTEIEAKTKEEREKEILERRHRDSVWKLAARLADTISVFMYQGAVFYVQLNVYNNQSVCDQNGCYLRAPTNSVMVWVYIEVFMFYLYMLSSVVFIAYHQFVEGICFKKDQAQSDMRKTFTDFLTYADANLIWFAFNFILVFMPLVCMF